MTDYYLNIYQAIPQDKRKQVLESLELLVKIIKDAVVRILGMHNLLRRTFHG